MSIRTSKFLRTGISITCFAIAASLTGFEATTFGQEDQTEATKADPTQSEATQQDDVPETTVAETRNPREMRLKLWDGTIISGDVGTSSLHVQTQFGMLEVPVSSILLVRPGLDSLTGLREEMEQLVEDLGDRDFKKREEAVQRIAQMGPMWRDYLAGLSDGGSAERKKHLQFLIQQLSDDLENLSDDPAADSDSSMIGKQDSVTTGEFTIVGRVQEQEFDLTTRFGMLRIQLADIKSADRQWMQESITVRKSIDVGATSFFQNKPESTGLRVRKGDRISIRVSGSVQWSSWGNLSSGPEGIPNHGQWKSMNCGMLAANIGKSDDYIPVGEDLDFVAAQDGELMLGIAMQDNYAAQQGYQWNGKYTAKVVVVSGNAE